MNTTRRRTRALSRLVWAAPSAIVILLLAGPGPAAASAKEDKALIRSLDNEVKALREKLKVYEESGGDCTALSAPDPIYAELVQLFAGSAVRVSRHGSHTLVELPAALIFATDDVRLREEGAFSLDLLSTALNAHKTERAIVTGHTQAQPPPTALRRRYPTNLDYSVARASAVTIELITRFGVASTRLTVAGRGEADPIASNDTPGEAAENERVVVEIIPGGTR